MSNASAGGLVLRGGRMGKAIGLGFLASLTLAGAATFSVVNSGDGGPGTLRQAILNANATAETNLIDFHLPGTGPFTIQLQSTLPPITPYPVIIDGTTQEGYEGRPVIELNGAGVGALGDGIFLLAGNSVVRGLAINRCKRDGIRIEGGGSNVIQGNFLGTGLSGTNSLPNVSSGLTINRSSGNVIGGTNPWEGNLLSGNNNGMFILGPASNNVVEGNRIGVSRNGSPLGNKTNGVVISSAMGNRIGGVVQGAGNVISGNHQSGIYLAANANSNFIQGNFIGTDPTGTAVLSNRVDGITVNGGSGNWIGGTEAGAGNLISGNQSRGILIANLGASNNVVFGNFIGTDLTGSKSVPNRTNGIAIFAAAANVIGGPEPLQRNLISGNEQGGVLIIQAGASNNVIQGNLIGSDCTGTNLLANAGNGVTVSGASRNSIGGAAAGGGNLISGNTQAGVYLVDNCTENLIRGNYIGADLTGKGPMGNGYDGVWLQAPGNLVSGNLISGNRLGGIYVYSAGASNNVIQGNLVGTDSRGLAVVSNGMAGVIISNAPGTLIGGTGAFYCNVISGNYNNGISISGANAKRTVIQGNFIGTDLTGTKALGNWGGIYIYGSASNLIGGELAGAGNLISGNLQDGISLRNAGAVGNVVQGNWIGTRADGVSSLGNQSHNIEIINGASGNLIGGESPEAENRIAFARSAGYDGVRIQDGCPSNVISRNSIYSNGSSSPNGLGIDLGTDGVTTNGVPVLTAAASAGNTAISGSISTTANKTVLLQFYANTQTNTSGYGEGMTYLTSAVVTTDSKGKAAYEVLAPAVAPGQFITATATPTNANTTEFSRPVRVAPGPVPSVSFPLAATVVTNANGTTNLVYTRSGACVVTWPAGDFVFTLLEATNLMEPVQWTVATNPPLLNGGSNQVTLPTTNGSTRFFQLRLQ